MGSPDGDATRPPPGWYPDPFERTPSRWWDGERWSGYAGSEHAVEWDPTPLEEPPTEPDGLRGVGVGLVGAVLGFGVSYLIVVALEAADDPGGRAAALGLSELALWSGLIGACIVVSTRRGSGSLVRDFDFRFRRIDLGLGLAGALAGRLVSAMVLAPIPFPSQSLRDVDRTVLDDHTRGALAWLVLVLVTCVGAPLVEELFFRGLVQTRLVTVLGPAVGIVVASLLFGAAHLVAWNGPLTLAYAWAVAGAGLVFGVLRHSSGRLGPSIAAHAIFNAQAMVLLALLG